jgi:hypothetical protein
MAIAVWPVAPNARKILRISEVATRNTGENASLDLSDHLLSLAESPNLPKVTSWITLSMSQSAKTQQPRIPALASVYRIWRTVPADTISDGTRIAQRIRLPSSSDLYQFWGRCIAGLFQKERSARSDKEGSLSLRGASRAPFVLQALPVSLSSDS